MVIYKSQSHSWKSAGGSDTMKSSDFFFGRYWSGNRDNFVMTLDGQLIGQNMFMKAVIAADDGRSIPIMTMGPICIAPELKRKGYGKILLDYSLEKAKELGCGAVCFEGNIDFYGKSGFKRQASLASAIMDCRKARMHLSFCAKN